jgi:hypothetical protein
VEIKDNFNMFNLFLNKKIKITIDKHVVVVRVPTIKEFIFDEDINAVYHIWTLTEEKIEKLTPFNINNSLDFTKQILFFLSAYKEYSEINKKIKYALSFFLPDIQINYETKELIINDITITNEV